MQRLDDINDALLKGVIPPSVFISNPQLQLSLSYVSRPILTFLEDKIIQCPDMVWECFLAKSYLEKPDYVIRKMVRCVFIDLYRARAWHKGKAKFHKVCAITRPEHWPRGPLYLEGSPCHGAAGRELGGESQTLGQDFGRRVVSKVFEREPSYNPVNRRPSPRGGTVLRRSRFMSRICVPKEAPRHEPLP